MTAPGGRQKREGEEFRPVFLFPFEIERAPLARSPALTGGPPSPPALPGGAMRHCAPTAIGPALTGGAMTPDAISGTGMQQTDPPGPGLPHQRSATRHTFLWVPAPLVWS